MIKLSESGQLAQTYFCMDGFYESCFRNLNQDIFFNFFFAKGECHRLVIGKKKNTNQIGLVLVLILNAISS